MRMEEGTKQWAIFAFALQKVSHTKLKNFTADLFGKALDLAISKGDETLEEPVTLTIDLKTTNEILAIIASDHRMALILEKMIAQEAFKIESEADLHAKFRETVKSIDPAEVVARMSENRAGQAAKTPEAPGPSASERQT